MALSLYASNSAKMILIFFAKLHIMGVVYSPYHCGYSWGDLFFAQRHEGVECPEDSLCPLCLRAEQQKAMFERSTVANRKNAKLSWDLTLTFRVLHSCPLQ